MLRGWPSFEGRGWPCVYGPVFGCFAHLLPFSLTIYSPTQWITLSHTCVTPPQAPQHPLRRSQRVHAAGGGVPGGGRVGCRVESRNNTSPSRVPPPACLKASIYITPLTPHTSRPCWTFSSPSCWGRLKLLLPSSCCTSGTRRYRGAGKLPRRCVGRCDIVASVTSGADGAGHGFGGGGRIGWA